MAGRLNARRKHSLPNRRALPQKPILCGRHDERIITPLFTFQHHFSCTCRQQEESKRMPASPCCSHFVGVTSTCACRTTRNEYFRVNADSVSRKAITPSLMTSCVNTIPSHKSEVEDEFFPRRKGKQISESFTNRTGMVQLGMPESAYMVRYLSFEGFEGGLMILHRRKQRKKRANLPAGAINLERELRPLWTYPGLRHDYQHPSFSLLVFGAIKNVAWLAAVK